MARDGIGPPNGRANTSSRHDPAGCGTVPSCRDTPAPTSPSSPKHSATNCDAPPAAPPWPCTTEANLWWTCGAGCAPTKATRGNPTPWRCVSAPPRASRRQHCTCRPTPAWWTTTHRWRPTGPNSPKTARRTSPSATCSATRRACTGFAASSRTPIRSWTGTTWWAHSPGNDRPTNQAPKPATTPSPMDGSSVRSSAGSRAAHWPTWWPTTSQNRWASTASSWVAPLRNDTASPRWSR